MPPEAATLAVALHSGAERIMARCDRARRAGVEPGQMRAHAQTLLDVAPLVVPYEPTKNKRVLERLANFLHKFSPRIVLEPPNGLLLDLTGMERIEPNERALVLRIRESFVGLELHARLAVAPTAGAARALARFGTVSQSRVRCPDRGAPLPIFLIEKTEMIRSAIEPLPIASLDLDEAVLAALAEVRVQYVGQLLRLSRVGLARRYGQTLLRTIDEMMGEAFEVLVPVQQEQPLCVEHHFDGPTTRQEAIFLATEGLVDRLADRLAKQESGALRLVLELLRVDVDAVRLEVRLGHPNRCASHLNELLRPLLETVNLGFGVEGVCLGAPERGRLTHVQGIAPEVGGRDGSSQKRVGGRGRRAADRSVGELFDRLRTRFGQERVCVALATVAATSLRPTLLFERPERVDVTGSGLLWRGAMYEIVARMGPERIAPSWWKQHALDENDPVGRTSVGTRSFYRMADRDGRWFWVHALERVDGLAWYLNGVWA